MLTGGDTDGGQSLIVSGTGLMFMAKLGLRVSTRVDDKGWLDDVLVGNWELMVRAEVTTV